MKAKDEQRERLKPLSLYGVPLKDAMRAAMEAPPPEESRRPKQKRAKKPKATKRRAKGDEKRARKKPREK